MKISFIVPVYNAQQYIEECVRSIMRQAYKDIQIILVDDGSTDDSLRYCLKLQEEDGRIEVYSQENQGVSIARNVGMLHAVGEWITFVDADDSIAKNYVEIFKDYLEKDYDVCCGEDGLKKAKLKGAVYFLGKKQLHAYERGVLNKYIVKDAPHLTSAWGKLYRTDFLRAHDIKFQPGLRKSEDALFNQYVFHYAKKGIYISQKIYYYKRHGESVSNRYDKDSVSNYREHLYVVQDFMKKEGIYNKIEDDYWVRAVFNFFYCIATDFCHKDNPYKYKARKEKFVHARNSEPFASAFQYGKCKGFPAKEKVLFYCIRYRLFAVTELIFIIGRLVGAVR